MEKLVSVKDINYKLDNILVNTNEDIINGYLYLNKDKENNSYRDIIKEKIIPILSQDIIFTLPLSDLSKEKREFDSLNNDIQNLDNKYNSLQEYLINEKRGKENILIVYTFSNTGEEIKLDKKENYLERITSEINNEYKFYQILEEFYENKYKTLILKFESENAKYINYFISIIKNYKEINKIKDDTKKYIFTINIKREFDLKKNKNKVTTILIMDKNINQLFIDNINGGEFPIKDVKNTNIRDFINIGPKRLIEEVILKFFRENKTEQLGRCKGIDINNFIKEFTKFIENSEEIINDFKKIILLQIDNSEKIIDSIITNKSINKNTIDFITAMTNHIKTILNEKIKLLLTKTENDKFLTTIFMLNVKAIGKGDSNSTSPNFQSDVFSLNISDMDILNNEIIGKIKKEYIKILREKNNVTENNESVNIKINYKIPGFFYIYKEIKSYIEKEKISAVYRQDEKELRESLLELVPQSMIKLTDDVKDFIEKLYVELTSKRLVNKVIETKIEDKNYIQFVELFLKMII